MYARRVPGSFRSLRDAVRSCPLLKLDEFAALRRFKGMTLPNSTETTRYHLDVVRLFATTICGTLDQTLRAKPKRGANLDSYRGELSLLSFSLAATHCRDLTGNGDLINPPNGPYLVDLIASTRASLAEPIIAAAEGRDRLAVGSTTARLAIEVAERNRLKTKVEPLELTMMLPTILRIALETLADAVRTSAGSVLEPLETGDAGLQIP